MGVLRNRKVKIILLSLLFLTAAEVMILRSAFDAGIWESVTAAAVGVAAAAVYLTTEIVQSKRINRFYQKIESNLHGHRETDWEQLQEGEFESLQSAIVKMVNAHYAQQDALEEEKLLLKQALNDISHQIKTPLASIALTVDLLSQTELDPLEQKLRLERMETNVERIQFFVKTLLDISRIDAGVAQMRQETFTVHSLIRSACDSLAELFEAHNVEIQTDIPPDLTVQGDKRWLGEAVTNIIKNGVEKTPDGGMIMVFAEDNPVYTQITIRDTGVGIAPEDLPKIFDRFYTGTNSGSGSVGIGLNLARKVIHSMGGTVTAENHPDGGALFTIRMYKINV